VQKLLILDALHLVKWSQRIVTADWEQVMQSLMYFYLRLLDGALFTGQVSHLFLNYIW